MIDSHQHFWALARGDYDWPNESVATIFRDFAPGDLTGLIAQTGITQTVLVQATDSVAETEFLLELAAQHDFIAGVVGWVDLAAPDAIETMDRLRQNPALVGLRPMLQNITQTDWILDPALTRALAYMADTGLRFDALIQPRHLTAIAALARRHPDLKIVIDHIAKPPMARGLPPDPTWLNGMTKVAQIETVFCKLSGLVTEFGADWTPDDLRPFADIVLRLFGPDRLMFGSDWPVINLAADYATWIEFVRTLIAPLSPAAQAKIFHQTAHKFYQLPD